MRNRPYERGLIDGRLGHRQSNGYLTRWARRSYDRGFDDGQRHYFELRRTWAARAAA
jgi:hypothetical protein